MRKAKKMRCIKGFRVQGSGFRVQGSEPILNGLYRLKSPHPSPLPEGEGTLR